MNRIAAEVEYCGYQYHGWQKQPDVRTIQNEIENSIFLIAGEHVETFASGRTDTGVHALGQVFHFDVKASRPITAWVKGLNALLPNSIRIKWAQEVSQQFHARYSVINREYQYLLYNHAIQSAVYDGLVGWSYHQLDNTLVKSACKKFEGEHDFSSFRSSECQAKSPVRTINLFNCEFFGNFYLFKIQANGFLHHQIRNMLATIITVSRGAKELNYIDSLFDAKDRSMAPPTFMPDGLYLTNIKYDDEWALPQKYNSVNIFAHDKS